MKKTLILLFFAAFAINLLKAQLVSFDFNTSPYIVASYVNSNVTVNNIALSTGTFSTNITTGTYFPNEPYIEETGGWEAVTVETAKYLYIDIIAKSGYTFNLTDIAFEAYVTSAGPSAISIIVNDVVMTTIDIADAVLLPVTQTLSDFNNLSQATIKIAGWDNGSRTTTGTGTLRFDSFSIGGTTIEIPPNDGNSSVIINPLSVPQFLSSLNTQKPGVSVCEIVFTDSASGDEKPTLIHEITFTAGTFNEFSDWTQALSGATLVGPDFIEGVSGIITPNSIVFNTAGLLTIDEGIFNAAACSLNLWFKPSIPDADRKQFDIYTDAGLIKCSDAGSQIQSANISTGTDRLIVTVEATESRMLFSDSILFTDSLFSIDAWACDAYGNLDIDYVGMASLSAQSNIGLLQSIQKLSGNFVNGRFDLDSIWFNGTDTAVFQLLAQELPTLNSKPFIIGKYLFADDFETGGLNKWGNTSDWIASGFMPIADNYSLKHNLSNVGGNSFITGLTTEIPLNAGKRVWQFEIQNGNFNPSTSNSFGYYLMAASDSLTGKQMVGYAIGVNLGNDIDTLALWRIDKGSIPKMILKTSLKWLPNTQSYIEVIREVPGIWSITIDTTKTHENAITSNSISDNTYNFGPYHGLVFNFTSTRAGLLKADNVNLFQMNTGPKILAINTLSESQIEVVFSETVGVVESGNLFNFHLSSENDADIQLISASLNTDSTDRVVLAVNRLKTVEYTLIIDKLVDTDGLEVHYLSANFEYQALANHSDIVFTEIMADPTPPNGLPEFEYIEIFNRSSNTINLGNWQLAVNQNIKLLPDYSLKPDSFLVIMHPAAAASYGFIQNKMLLPGFPAITNASGYLSLSDDKGLLITELNYTDSWYGNNEKQEGGWSLEVVDPDNICGGIYNWTASIHAVGGTPGIINSVDKPNLDQLPPKLVKFMPINDRTLWFQFSEPLLTESITPVAFKFQNLSIPFNILLDITQSNQLVLEFDQSFPGGLTLELQLNALTDICWNTLTDTTLFFQHRPVSIYDVVINEIMMNPEPSMGLPENEYVELFNRSHYDLDAYNWTISVGSSIRTIPPVKIPKQSYLIVCNEADTAKFLKYGNIIGVPKLSALPLTGTIQIASNLGKLICATDYQSGWITDDFKADGGFSLERIDFNNPLENELNWKATENEQGGTPGKINSIFAANADTDPPSLLRAFPVNDTIVGLRFSEPLNTDLLSIELFAIEGSKESIENISLQYGQWSVVYLELKETLHSGVEYVVNVSSAIQDIAGNFIDNHSVVFALPTKASINDVVINELLWNPNIGGSDFVEIYNRSAFPVNMSQFMLAAFSDLGEIKDPCTITSEGAILLPNQYLVLSQNIDAVKQQYIYKNEQAFLQMAKQPSFPNDGGSVVLMDTAGLVIDYLYYTPKMHFELISNTQGVSLERINYNAPASESSNWHSAAEAVGWATPGYQNSVFHENGETNQIITIDPEVFTPNGDGVKDVLFINYRTAYAGYVANISVFDIKGRLVRKIAQNELLANEGTFIWEGINDNYKVMPAGIYIIYSEFFDLDGNIKKYRNACAINARFD